MLCLAGGLAGGSAGAGAGAAGAGAVTNIELAMAAMLTVASARAIRFRPSFTSGRSPLCLTPTGLADGFGRQSDPTHAPRPRSAVRGERLTPRETWFPG